MSTIQLLLQELEHEPIKNKIILKFPVILKEIYILFECIKTSKDVKSADVYFSLLEKIQRVLARLTFRDGIILPQELRKIVRDCDRLDDDDVRNFLFDAIKKGTYSLTNDTFLWYT